MNVFSELGIVPTEAQFVGKKVDVDDILNEQIIVYEFKIKPSKYPKKGDEQCLHLQIEQDGTKKVIFTPSKNLMDVILQVPTEKFPFTTIIKKNHKRLEFT